MPQDLLRGKRVLVLASTGGHLAQAVKWSRHFGFAPDSMFVTFDTPQSQQLLVGRNVHFVDYVEPRDWWAIAKAAVDLLRTMRRGRYDVIFSTGAGLALSGVPLAIAWGIGLIYVESVSRFAGPSLTGRVLERVPFVRRFAQHPTYDSRRWTEVPPLLGEYAVDDSPATTQAPDGARGIRVLVTLGTIQPYRFDRLIDTVRACLGPDDEVVWQTGCTSRDDLPGTTRAMLDAQEFSRLVETSDVIVTHAGVGTLLQLLDEGKRPVVLARTSALGEHVDDHQSQVLGRLTELGLVINGDTDLHRDDLLRSARSRVVTTGIGAVGCS